MQKPLVKLTTSVNFINISDLFFAMSIFFWRKNTNTNYTHIYIIFSCKKAINVDEIGSREMKSCVESLHSVTSSAVMNMCNNFEYELVLLAQLRGKENAMLQQRLHP